MMWVCQQQHTHTEVTDRAESVVMQRARQNAQNTSNCTLQLTNVWFWQFWHQFWTNTTTAVRMNFSTTDSWIFINTSLPVLAAAGSSSNTSPTSPTEDYLQRLAHFDEGLYNDFYSLWITLMVVNFFIFLVGTLVCLVLMPLVGPYHWEPPVSSPSTGGHSAQHDGPLCVLLPHQAKDHLHHLHHQPGGDGPAGQPVSTHSHPALLQRRGVSHLLLPAHLQLLCQHVLQHLVPHLHLRGPLPCHRAGWLATLGSGLRPQPPDMLLNCLFFPPAGWSIPSVAELQRGQVRVRLCLAVCHCGHLLLPLHSVPARRLFPFEAALSHRHGILPAPCRHHGFHSPDHVGTRRPAADAAEQVDWWWW